MNNEVLRRKLFRTVLADSRSPAGILASSPEMVETVQRRYNGGLNAITGGPGSQTVSDAFRRTRGRPTRRDLSGAGMPEGTQSYLELLEQIKDLPIKQQQDILLRAGYGVTVGPDRTGIATVDPEVYETETSKNIMSFLGSLKGTGEVARPKTTRTQSREASGLSSLLGPQFDADDPRTEAAMAMATPGAASVDSGIPSMLPNSPDRPSVRSPFTPRPLVEDEDIVDDEYTSMTPVTPGEVLSASSVSGAGTETSTQDGEKKKDRQAKTIKPSVNESKLNGMLQQAAAGTLLTDSGKTTVRLNADEAATPQAAAVLAPLIKPEETSLSQIQDRAKEIMGFDPDKAKGDKKDAFWRNLTMAGLAIAAGESDNALSNVAKGLMVGLDSYSKDIKEISAQDAELQKEYRATVRDLVKTDKDEKIALAGIENNYNAAKTQLEQRQNEFESTDDYRNAQLALDADKFNKQMVVSLSGTLAGLEIKRETLALQQQTLDETVAQNEIGNRLNELKNEPEFVKVARSLGYVDEKGDWTETGLDWRAKTTDDAIMDLQLISSKSSKTGPLAPEQDRYVLDSLGSEASLEQARIDLAAQGNNNPSAQDFEDYFIGQYKRVQAGGGSQQPVSPASNISTDDHIAANAAAKKAGESTYTIGTQTFSVQ